MLERVLIWLFPRLQLEGTPFYEGWHAQERAQDTPFWRALFPALAVLSIAKGYLLQPNPMPGDWLQQHWMIAGLCLATTLLYCLPSLIETRLYRYPAALALLSAADAFDPAQAEAHLVELMARPSAGEAA